MSIEQLPVNFQFIQQIKKDKTFNQSCFFSWIYNDQRVTVKTFYKPIALFI